MDLYRILRQSLYLMVGAGAFSLSIAEQNLWYLIAAVFFGVLALELLDSGRFKPAQREFIAAMTLALFVYNLMVPLREEHGWEKNYPAAFAHFLFAFQILLLFTAYNDWVLILVGISSLAIVIIAGVIDHNATLLLRMACFVALTAWTLFIHSLWRARENFNISQKLQSARNPVAANDATRGLSERALMQGVSMTAVLSVACMALGLALFFSAPRLDRINGWIESWGRGRDTQNGTSSTSPFRDDPSKPRQVGYSDAVDLSHMGPLHQNQGEALSLTLPKYTKELAESNGHVYLRGSVFSHQMRGKWFPPPRVGESLVAEKDKWIQLPGMVRNTGMVEQIVSSIGLHSRQYLAVAPAARLAVPKVELDAEGAMHVPAGAEMDSYHVWSYPPRRQTALPPNAKAEHPEYNTYVNDFGLNKTVEPDVREFARSKTRDCNTDLEKARAILALLKDSGRYNYTLNLDELTRLPNTDPIHEFLLNPDPKERRGHCGYFATAFVVLCRLNDIPARLATGFCTKMPDAAEEDTKKIDFKNADAHAWAEVYFKDYGWVVFDPTPPAPEEPKIAAPPPTRPPPTQPAVKPEVAERTGLQRAWDKVIGYNSQEQREIYDTMGQAMRNSLGGAGEILAGSSGGGWLGALFAWICTGLFIYWIMQLFLRRGTPRVGRGGPGGRVHAAVSFYNDLLQVLSRQGYVRRPGQTPREFAEYVIRMGGEPFKSVLLVTNVFEGVRYGGAEMSQDEFNSLQDALDSLRELAFASPVPAAKS